jgi:predicted cupin superfamily sugar epimerase
MRDLESTSIRRMLTADQLIEMLGLLPHPEGGYFAETFRSAQRVGSKAHEGPRDASTAIYFLLRTGEFSALHRVRSDEVWHHYLGDSLELHELDTRGRWQLTLLGSDIERGERPQAVVGAHRLQAARPIAGRYGYALCGCTVAPGFEFADFEMPPRAELLEQFPEHAGLIGALSR